MDRAPMDAVAVLRWGVAATARGGRSWRGKPMPDHEHQSDQAERPEAAAHTGGHRGVLAILGWQPFDLGFLVVTVQCAGFK